VNYPWREHHIGMTLTHTELKIDGISVTDEHGNGETMSNHSDRDVTVLVNLLEDKLEDFGEQYARTMNTLMWGDGTADAKALAGMLSIIVGRSRTPGRPAACPARPTPGGRTGRRRRLSAAPAGGADHVGHDQRRRAAGSSCSRNTAS
jgi:hypothetical protein